VDAGTVEQGHLTWDRRHPCRQTGAGD